MTEADYLNLKNRVKMGADKIAEAGGFLNAPKHWVMKYQQLAEQMLDYEIKNDLLPVLL